MKPELRALDADGVRHIAWNLRDRDHAEIFATRWSESPEGLVDDVMRARDFAWMTVKNGEPIAIIGAVPVWPSVWNIFAFGTERWPETVVTLTRHALHFITPALYNAGCKRAQCYSLKEHEDARRWLELLEIHAEREVPAFGKNGETFVAYAWLRDEWEARHVLDPGRKPAVPRSPAHGPANGDGRSPGAPELRAGPGG